MLDKFYSRFLEDIALPVGLLPTRSRFWRLLREMRRVECQPSESLQQLQWSKLQALLEHAEKNVPYYRERWNLAGVSSSDLHSIQDLSQLPRTTKVEVQRNFPDRIVDEFADRSAWQYVSTRGTANRLVAIQDFAKRDFGRAAAFRSLYHSGNYRLGNRTMTIPPDACNVLCGDEVEIRDTTIKTLAGITAGGWRDPGRMSDMRRMIQNRWLMRKLVLPPFGETGSNPPIEVIEGYIEQIENYRPYILKALPTYLHQIANHIVRTGRPPLPVEVVKPFGGSVSGVVRERISHGFRGQYREDYGSAEFGAIACDCIQREGMHVFSDLFVVEIVRGTASCEQGQRGRVLITDLSNFAMPLIRYDIGDVGRFVESSCPCGLAAVRFVIEGRVEDCLVLECGTLIPSDMVCDALYSCPSVDQFQLTEEQPGEFELLVVPCDDGREAIEQAVAAVRSLVGDNVIVHSYLVGTIPAEESGKFRFVKSVTHDRFDLAPVTSQRDG